MNKELESLERLKNGEYKIVIEEGVDGKVCLYDEVAEKLDYELIKYALKRKEKLEKDLEVLNIIIEKLVDLSWLMYALNSTSSIEKALNVYNDKYAGNIPLTLEEISKLNRRLEK